MERGGRLAGLPTGFVGFDDMTGGLEPGQLVIVAARPSVGKTVLGCNIAAHVAAGGSPVLFFTLEMTRREIAARILAARSGVPVSEMRAGTRERDDWDQMNTAVASSASWKLFIDDSPAVSVAYVRAKARRIQRTHGLGLLVIDYLGLMRGTGDNRAQEVGSISRGLKALAKELKVPVVALAQLNRASEGRLDRRPTLADLRDSGEIEQDADIVAMLHRESMHREAPEWEGLAQLLIRKNRNGPTGECLLALDGPRMRFTDYHGPCPVAARPEKPAQRKGFEA
jgi:replicative DNA helicase